ncbi:MAG: DNA repair protein RecO [Alphaproteobacteria bacterium]|nr:DNA repair protein RecO [Alphaproteobacteria bacterium]
MEWIDDGFVLGARKHGESAVIVTLLTREHGRHAGLVRGGAGARARGVWQPGNLLRVTWRARLAEHLGNFTAELLRSHAAGLLDERLPLLALSSATALVEAALPEREPHPALFEGLAGLLAALPHPGWAAAYVRWELALLTELGFGLDLGSCAATGAAEGLTYVSPRSGRAVSAAAGEAWRDRLLPLPGFLTQGPSQETTANTIADGLRLTGYFLARHALGPDARALPPARARLADALAEVAG